MRSVLLITSLLIFYCGVGQSHFIGLHGGINQYNIKSEMYFQESKPMQGMQFGVLYETKLNEFFIIGISANVINKGFYKKVDRPLGLPQEKQYLEQYSLTYGLFPIKVGLELPKRFSPFINLTFATSILGSAKIFIVSDDFSFFPEGADDISNTFREIEFAAQIEVGARYAITKRLNAFVSFAPQIGVSSITSTKDYPEENNKLNGANATVGIKMNLCNDDE